MEYLKTMVVYLIPQCLLFPIFVKIAAIAIQATPNKEFGLITIEDITKSLTKGK